MDYLELTVSFHPRNPWAEILISQLAENGYESFVETEDGIQAYAQVVEINPAHPIANTLLTEVNTQFTATWETKIIPQQNWNAVWEADFQPVEVEDYLTILAPFHDKTDKKGLLIEILPKMSFGTGHHQTTWMMAKALIELKKMPTNVLDMGTGTGVLAIIAEKRGATNVVAVDIEDWSIENTLENAERNTCFHIEAICGDIDVVREQKFGLILANINKNVLKSHLPDYARMLEENGVILLSGFFSSDVNELVAFAAAVGLSKTAELNKDNWAAVEFKKN